MKEALSKIKNNPLKALAYVGAFLFSPALVLLCIPVTSFAATDPLGAVNNLSDFILGLIRAIRLIILGFGVVQVGLSFKSQDPRSGQTGFSPLRAALLSPLQKKY